MGFDLIERKSDSTEYKKRKNIRQLVQSALYAELPETRKQYYKDNGIDLSDEDYNLALEMIMGQAKSAAANGNTTAFKELLALAEDTADEGQLYELPARLIGRAFIDLYRMIHNREYSEYVLKGGRMSLKSTFASLIVLELIKQNPTMHALIVRPYENTLRDSVYAQLMWSITEMSDNSNWKCTTSPLQCTYKPTGQMIFLRGADDPAKIKSIKTQFGYIGILWFEELDQFKGEEQIRNVTQSALRGGDVAYLFKSFNPPRSRASWANKYSKVNKSNMYVHTSTYLEAPREWLGQFALDEAEHLKETNEKAYLNEYLGEEIGDGANVFDNVTLRAITDEEISRFDRCYAGQDWGWFPDPNVIEAMYYNMNQRVLYLFDEEKGNKVPNEVWKDRIQRFARYQITADSSEMKSVGDFRSYGFNMIAARKGPNSVEYSMKWLASLKEIIIDPNRCPLAAKEFVDYENERDKNGDVITSYPDKDNHSIDAVRYALEEIWKRSGM